MFLKKKFFIITRLQVLYVRICFFFFLLLTFKTTMQIVSGQQMSAIVYLQIKGCFLHKENNISLFNGINTSAS